jgi:hypothetical protein
VPERLAAADGRLGPPSDGAGGTRKTISTWSPSISTRRTNARTIACRPDQSSPSRPAPILAANSSSWPTIKVSSRSAAVASATLCRRCSSCARRALRPTMRGSNSARSIIPSA